VRVAELTFIHEGFGNDESVDKLRGSYPRTETGERCLRRAINQRFYTLPAYACVKVREPRGKAAG
jgi:hypothetical protein